MSVVALTIDGHSYVVLFDDEGACEALQAAQRFADDPELPFDRQDAQAMTEAVRRLAAAARND